MADTSTKHSELEIKLDAKGVPFKAFFNWCVKKNPGRYEYVSGPDQMYKIGKNVIRHRYRPDGSYNELTVKNRKSSKSILDRYEVDLKFLKEVSVEDVTKFLELSGWKKTFVLWKRAWIFWFDDVSVVYYVVSKNGLPKSRRKFVEVEVTKELNLSLSASKKLLESWRKKISKDFKVNKPLNQSLYEIYSGNKYIKYKKGK